MKKFITSLVILIILGGVAFFFGWAQFMVPPGEYGVMISKTHGVDHEIIKEGQFRWIWFKLIPTNVKILTFKLNPLEKPISVKGNLPSGDTYAAFSGISMDFSYQVDGTFSFLLKPETLPKLVETQAITDQASLNTYLNSLSEKISAFTVQQLQVYTEDRTALEKLLGNPVPVSLADNIQSAFPEITNFTCTINVARFPDFDLYDSAKSMYQDYLAQQREILKNQVTAAAAERIYSQQRFDELEKYGELLTKYPILIQYLAIEKGSDEVIRTLFQNKAP